MVLKLFGESLRTQFMIGVTLLGVMVGIPEIVVAEQVKEFRTNAPTALSMTHGPEGAQEAMLSRMAISQMAALGTALGITPGELENPTTQRQGTVLYARTARWVYYIDIQGNQTLRPCHNLAHVALNPKQAQFSYEELNRLPDSVRNIAIKAGLNLQGLRQTVIKREMLLAGKYNGQMETYSGRKLVRIKDFFGGDTRYLQILFDASLKPIRLDTNIQNPVVNSLKVGIAAEVQNNPITPLPSGEKMTIGSFFASTEYRFEISANGFEGEDFLDVQASRNPWKKGDMNAAPHLLVDGQWNDQRTDLVDVPALAKTQNHKFWEFLLWDLCGRVGGLRGNWISTTGIWERPGIDVLHRSLTEYGLVAGEPKETRTYTLTNNVKRAFPFAVSQQLEPRFYQELETCTVAALITHAGTIDNTLQLGRSLDVWFKLGNPNSRLGSGNLRHLFFLGCSTMDYYLGCEVGEPDALLPREWMRAAYIAGLRTASGCDGVFVQGGNVGMKVAGHYNKGESVSDAWLLANADECDINLPVTVAYGTTQNDTFKTLLDSRFSGERAEPVWAVTSNWQAVPQLLTPPDNAIWLDLLDVTKIRQGWGKARPRANLNQQELSVAGKKYQQGIGTHAESRFAVDLKGSVTRFTATVGVDDGASSKASVIFEVWVDDRLVKHSSLLRKGDQFNFDVDLTDARVLGLRVTDGGDGGDSDHADWCNALLYLAGHTKEKPEAMVIAANE